MCDQILQFSTRYYNLWPDITICDQKLQFLTRYIIIYDHLLTCDQLLPQSPHCQQRWRRRRSLGWLPGTPPPRGTPRSQPRRAVWTSGGHFWRWISWGKKVVSCLGYIIIGQWSFRPTVMGSNLEPTGWHICWRTWVGLTLIWDVPPSCLGSR